MLNERIKTKPGIRWKNRGDVIVDGGPFPSVKNSNKALPSVKEEPDTSKTNKDGRESFVVLIKDYEHYSEDSLSGYNFTSTMSHSIYRTILKGSRWLCLAAYYIPL